MAAQMEIPVMARTPENEVYLREIERLRRELELVQSYLLREQHKARRYSTEIGHLRMMLAQRHLI